MRFAILLIILAATPGRAADFMGELQSSLVRFTDAHAEFSRHGQDSSLDAVTAAEMSVVEKIFSADHDAKLYLASLEEVNRRSKDAPAAISQLGNSLQLYWEKKYRVGFYEVQAQHRSLYQIPNDAILLAGSVLTAKAASPESVTRYFDSIRRVWAEGALVTTAIGSASWASSLMADLPRPPADVITLATHQLLDFRAREASEFQHRKNIAGHVGMVVGAGAAVAVGTQVVTKTPVGIVVGAVLVGGAGYAAGVTARDAAEWAFAASSEESLENEVATMMRWLYLAEERTRAGTAGTQDGVPVRLAAARALTDAVNRLHANRNLDFLLAEVPYLAEINALEAKYGNDPSPDRDLRLSQATSAYVETVKKLIAKRKPPLFDPLTTTWMGRQWLKALKLSPFVAAERQKMKDIVNQWPSPIREYGILKANLSPDPQDRSMTHDAGLKRFHDLLDEEATRHTADLLKVNPGNRRPQRCPCPTRFDLSKGSDAVYLQAAAFIRSMNDPSLENFAVHLENRVAGIVSRLLNATAPIPAPPNSPEKLIQTVDRYLETFAREAGGSPVLSELLAVGAPTGEKGKLDLEAFKEAVPSLVRRHETRDWADESNFRDLDRVDGSQALKKLAKQLLGRKATYPLVTSLGGTCYRIALAKNADHNEMVRQLILRYNDNPKERDALFLLLSCVSTLVQPQVEARNQDVDVLITRMEEGLGYASLALLFYDWRSAKYPGLERFKAVSQARWEALINRFQKSKLSDSRALVLSSPGRGTTANPGGTAPNVHATDSRLAAEAAEGAEALVAQSRAQIAAQARAARLQARAAEAEARTARAQVQGVRAQAQATGIDPRVAAEAAEARANQAEALAAQAEARAAQAEAHAFAEAKAAQGEALSAEDQMRTARAAAQAARERAKTAQGTARTDAERRATEAEARAAQAEARANQAHAQAADLVMPAPAPERFRWVTMLARGTLALARQASWNATRAGFFGSLPIGAYTLHEQSEAGKIHPVQVLRLVQLKLLGETWLSAESIAQTARSMAEDLRKKGVTEAQRTLARNRLKDLVYGYDVQERKGEQFSSTHLPGFVDLRALVAHLEAHATELQGLSKFPNIEKELTRYREKFDALKLIRLPEERVTAFLEESPALEKRIQSVDRQFFAEATARGFGPEAEVMISLAEIKMQLLAAEEALEAVGELVKPKPKPAKAKPKTQAPSVAPSVPG